MLWRVDVHPEEREWIEDVKQWARDFLTHQDQREEEYGINRESFLSKLVNGVPSNSWIRFKLTNSNTILGMDLLIDIGIRINWPTYPLGWIQIGNGYVLIESHRAAIYSVLKAWRKEQEGA